MKRSPVSIRADNGLDYRPRYVAIRDEIARRISTGDLEIGQQVPSLRQICDEFDVSSVTARRVLSELVLAGLVETVGGRGTFVRTRSSRPRVAVVMIGYTHASWREYASMFAQLVGGITEAVWSEDGILTVLPVPDTPAMETTLSDVVQDNGIDGILVRAAGHVNWTALDHLRKRVGVAVVVIKRRDPYGRFSSVVPDATMAGRLAVEHLLELGHREIGLVVARASLDTYKDHLRGARQALRRSGLRLAPEQLCTVEEPLKDYGRDTAIELLRKSRPTAVVTNSDILAEGVYEGAGHLGVTIPTELSVVGFDDVEPATKLHPALTTVRLPYYELGRAAAQQLFAVMRGGEGRTISPQPVDLVVRASTASPAPGRPHDPS